MDDKTLYEAAREEQAKYDKVSNNIVAGMLAVAAAVFIGYGRLHSIPRAEYAFLIASLLILFLARLYSYSSFWARTARAVSAAIEARGFHEHKLPGVSMVYKEHDEAIQVVKDAVGEKALPDHDTRRPEFCHNIYWLAVLLFFSTFIFFLMECQRKVNSPNSEPPPAVQQSQSPPTGKKPANP